MFKQPQCTSPAQLAAVDDLDGAGSRQGDIDAAGAAMAGTKKLPFLIPISSMKYTKASTGPF